VFVIFSKIVEVSYNNDVVRALALSLFFMISFTSQAEGTGRIVKTDDVCAAHPDKCGGSAFRNKKRKKHEPAPLDFSDFDENKKTASAKVQKSGKKKKKKPQGPVQDDFWEKESVDDIIPLDIDGPRRAPLPKQAVAPKFKRSKITFASYLNANYSHGAMGSGAPSLQDAFQAPTRPVTYSDNETGQSVRENTQPAVAIPNVPVPPAPN
jgi:hypothetical protein